MGFLNPTVPAVDPQEFLQRPFLERMRYLATFWAENGFGTPRMVHVIYIVKLAVFYTFGGLLVVSLTSDVGSVFDFALVVGRADRLREADPLDRAARGPRRRRQLGPAGRPLQADDRRHAATGSGPA